MVKLYDSGVYLVNGKEIVPAEEAALVKQMTGKGKKRRGGFGGFNFGGMKLPF